MKNEKMGQVLRAITTFTKEKLAVRVYANRLLMGEDAAEIVCCRINSLLGVQGFVNIIFAAAPSQNEFLAALSKKAVDWTRVNAFHMDEYIELPKNDSRTFAAFLNEKILGLLRFNTVNYLNGNAADIGDECRRYGELLQQYTPDIVCMGVGENGHLAFNDPHAADLKDPVKVKMVKLDAACRQQQVNDNCFAGLAQVPYYAITLTIPALMEGRYIYCMVPGEKKAAAVANTLYAEITAEHPSTVLRRHDNAVLFLDRKSAAML